MLNAPNCPIDGSSTSVEKVTAVMGEDNERLRQRLARPAIPARPQRVAHVDSREQATAAEAVYQTELHVWEANVVHVVTAQSLWDSRLYYCHQHDVIFLSGDARTAPPEGMLQLLTDPDVPVAAYPSLPPPDHFGAQVNPGMPLHDAAGSWEYCEITSHTSVLKVTFSAQAIGPAGTYVAATSGPIDAVRQGQDPFAAYRPVIDGLASTLQAGGWQPIDARGAYWYSLRYRRHLDNSLPTGAQEHWSTFAEALSDILTRPGKPLPESVARLAPAARSWVVKNLARGDEQAYEKAASAVRRTGRFLADSAATALGHPPPVRSPSVPAPTTIPLGPASYAERSALPADSLAPSSTYPLELPAAPSSVAAIDASTESGGVRQQFATVATADAALDMVKAGVTAIAVDHAAHLAERQQAEQYGGHLHVSAGLRVKLLVQRLLRPITICLEMIPGLPGEWYGPGDVITAIEAVAGVTLDGLRLSILERIIYAGASALPAVPARPIVGFYRRVEPWLRSEDTLAQRAATSNKFHHISGHLAGAGWAFLQSQLPPWLRVALPDPMDSRFPRPTSRRILRQLAGFVWLPFITYFAIAVARAVQIVAQASSHVQALAHSSALAHVFLLDLVLPQAQLSSATVSLGLTIISLVFIATPAVSTVARHDRLRESVTIAARHQLHTAHGELVSRVNDTLWQREPSVSEKLAESAQHLRDISLKAARSMMLKVIGGQLLQLAIATALITAAVAIGVALVVVGVV